MIRFLVLIGVSATAALPVVADSRYDDYVTRNKSDVLALSRQCASSVETERALCAAYLKGFIDGKKWGEESECSIPTLTPELLRRDFLSTVREQASDGTLGAAPVQFVLSFALLTYFLPCDDAPGAANAQER